MLPCSSPVEAENRPSSILSRLHSILSTFRGGGNKTLVDMLYKKMAEAESRSGPALAKPLLQSPISPGTSRSSGPSGAADDYDDLLCITPMEIGICDDHLPGMSYGMAPGMPYMNYPGDHDYGSIAPMHAMQEPADSSASVTASWASYNPVEMAIGDFLATQVPGAHFFEQTGLETDFMDGYKSEQTLAGDFMINSL